jgi:hypothetical protein
MSGDVIENLKKLTEEHEKELCDIREKIRVMDTIPKARVLVGKCFKYRNTHTFGAPTYGWTFKRIVGMTPDGVLVDSFTTEGPNRIEFIFNSRESVNMFSSAVILKITEKAYKREFNKMLKVLARMTARKSCI